MSQGEPPKCPVLLWDNGRTGGLEESGSTSDCICRAGVGEQEFKEQRRSGWIILSLSPEFGTV